MTKWPFVPLGEVADVRSGAGAPQDESAFGAAGFPFIRAGSLAHLVDGGSDSTLEHMTPEIAANYGHSLFPAGAVVFAKSGMSATKGLIYRLPRPSYVVNHLAVILPGSRIDSAYLRHCLHVQSPVRLIKDEAYPSIRLGEIAAVNLPLPDIKEQRSIAEALDRVEALRSMRRHALRRVDELPQSIFVQIFGDPRQNSRGWPVQRLSSLGSLDRGVSRHRPRNAPELLGGPYPFVQTGDVANSDGYIRRHSATYSERGLRQSKLWRAGTLCITIAANIAKTGILTFDACFPDSVVGFGSSEMETVEYVRVWLSFLQKTLEDSAPESAQKNINLAILRELPIPVPPESLRREFADRLGAVAELKERNRRSLASLDELLIGMRQHVFGGVL